MVPLTDLLALSDADALPEDLAAVRRFLAGFTAEHVTTAAAGQP
jgi:hypothetical protein